MTVSEAALQKALRKVERALRDLVDVQKDVPWQREF